MLSLSLTFHFIVAILCVGIFFGAIGIAISVRFYLLCRTHLMVVAHKQLCTSKCDCRIDDLCHFSICIHCRLFDNRFKLNVHSHPLMMMDQGALFTDLQNKFIQNVSNFYLFLFPSLGTDLVSRNLLFI